MRARSAHAGARTCRRRLRAVRVGAGECRCVRALAGRLSLIQSIQTGWRRGAIGDQAGLSRLQPAGVMSGFHRPMLKVVMFEQHRLVVVVYERDLYVPVPCGYPWTRRALLRGLRQVLRLLEHGWMLEELSGVAMSMTHEMLIVPEADMPGGVFNLAGLRKRSCLVVHTREGTLQARPPPASRCSTRSHASGY